MNHVDYFGVPINIGDVVLRVQNGYMYTTIVTALRKNTIGLKRKGFQWYNEEISKTPLFINPRNQIINLSKLGNSKIQETIKLFINEI